MAKIELLLVIVMVCPQYTKTQLTGSCSVCMPGRDGRDGVPGRDGRDGQKGDRGVTGFAGPKGSPGLKGSSGAKGMQGQKGSPGRGMPGIHGEPGPPGLDGRKGDRGLKGETGMIGRKGDKGYPGPQGTTSSCPPRNIKQFTWNEEHSDDTGKLKDFNFEKKAANTVLRVAFSGNARMSSSSRCNRWYITFNGTECVNPGKIEAAFYQSSSDNMLKPMYFEGLCSNLTQGQVTVALHIGPCTGTYRTGDAYTGWNSLSRIIVEEINTS